MATIGQMARYSFNNYGISGNGMNTSILGDYASLKNGSYKKLLKAYYNKTENSESGSNSTSKDSTKTIASVQSASADLIDSAEALTAKGSKSLFKKQELTTKDENGKETKTMGYDMDKIYKAVNEFVDDYNTMVTQGGKSDSVSVLKSTLSMTRSTSANKNLLSDVGITVGSDNKLKIDEDTFKKADINKIKTLFNGSNSYAANVEAKAEKIKSAAVNESLKANTYTPYGSYGNTYSTGNMYSSLF